MEVNGQSHAPAALQRPGTHCKEGSVGPRAGLDVWWKSRPLPGSDPRTVHGHISVEIINVLKSTQMNLIFLHAGAFTPQRYSRYSFVLSRPQGRSVTGIKSMPYIGNRIRDLPACSAVPQPTAPPRGRCIQRYCSAALLLYKAMGRAWYAVDGAIRSVAHKYHARHLWTTFSWY
jgi:hypothetical protein